MELQSKLFEAARQNSITSLPQLLKDDPLILERSFVNPLNETPLHVAALLGHFDFVKQIIQTHPHLACEVNLQKQTPLHLAAAKGHAEVVTALLSVDDRVTCLARDRNGLTPVHLAAVKGRDEAVKLLLEAQPDAARMLVPEDEETILHLCVKNYELEALKLILTTVDEAEFVNSKDAHGNTVLHLAVADKQVETIKYLVSNSVGAVEVKAVNNEGITALDVLIQSKRDVRDTKIKSLLRKDSTAPTQNNTRRSRKKTLKKPYAGWIKNKKSSLMVVAILIAAMAFQVGVSPPGGVWQEDKSTDSEGKPLIFPHEAGTSVFVDKNPARYIFFYVVNTTAFVASLSIILLLISGLPIRHRTFMWILMVITWIAIITTAMCYVVAIVAVTPTSKEQSVAAVTGWTAAVWIILIALLLITHTIRVTVKLVKIALMMRWRRSSTGSTWLAGP